METVKDIVEEMRNVASMYLSGGNDSTSVFEMLSTYSTRLDAAYDRNIEHRNATKRKYTADEMREAADALEYCGNPHSAAMLRQSAEMIETHCRHCDLLMTYDEAVSEWWALPIDERLRYRFDMAKWLFDKKETANV